MNIRHLCLVLTMLLFGGLSLKAQSADRDILVLEYGSAGGALNLKAYGMYVYWPDKEMEFTQLSLPSRTEEMILMKKTLYKKINEIVDLGWHLILVDNSTAAVTYYFEREK